MPVAQAPALAAAGDADAGGGCCTTRNRLFGSGATASRQGRDPKVIDTGARLLDTTVLPDAVIPASAASMSRTLTCRRKEPGSCTRERDRGGPRPFQLQQLQEQRRVRQPDRGQPVLATGSPIIADTSGLDANGRSSPVRPRRSW